MNKPITILGIDNVIFISILSGRLPIKSQRKARTWGLALAMIMRVLLLLSLSWIMGLTRPLFSLGNFEVSGRALILVGGGLFLLAKSTREIRHKMEDDGDGVGRTKRSSFSAVLIQIVLLDIVFSLDSVITAVGMVDEIGVMITAVIVAVGVMMLFAGSISTFIERHPTLKMLAFELPASHRGKPHWGRARLPHSQGLHLLRDGFLGAGRDAQHQSAQRKEA